MSASTPFSEARDAFEPGQLDAHFPGWSSIEIFGAPGAGKSFLCRRILTQRPLLATSDDQAARYFVDARMGLAGRFATRFLSQRLLKNYYKLRIDLMAQELWKGRDTAVRNYLKVVEQTLQEAGLPLRSEKNVRKSVRYTGLALALARKNQRPILIDEGLTRRLITLQVQSGSMADRSKLLDLIRSCLVSYPWEKNAVFIDAPPSLCIERQIARGHVIHRPSKNQAAQQAAAEKVFTLCKEAGWNTYRVWNAPGPDSLPLNMPTSKAVA